VSGQDTAVSGKDDGGTERDGAAYKDGLRLRSGASVVPGRAGVSDHDMGRVHGWSINRWIG